MSDSGWGNTTNVDNGVALALSR